MAQIWWDKNEKTSIEVGKIGAPKPLSTLYPPKIHPTSFYDFTSTTDLNGFQEPYFAAAVAVSWEAHWFHPGSVEDNIRLLETHECHAGKRTNHIIKGESGWSFTNDIRHCDLTEIFSHHLNIFKKPFPPKTTISPPETRMAAPFILTYHIISSSRNPPPYPKEQQNRRHLAVEGGRPLLALFR